MRRRFTFHSGIFALVAMLGLFAPFQMVFACDQMNEEDRLICCCDEPGMMGVLEGASGADSPDRCCDVSMEEKFEGVSQSVHIPGFSPDQVHPPPLLVSNFTPEILFSDGFAHTVDSGVPLPIGNPVYLLTNRFLI